MPADTVKDVGFKRIMDKVSDAFLLVQTLHFDLQRGIKIGSIALMWDLLEVQSKMRFLFDDCSTLLYDWTFERSCDFNFFDAVVSLALMYLTKTIGVPL